MKCPHGKTDRCAKCTREWNAKLAASDFQDLEGDKGELSDRGNLHPVAETTEEYDRLRDRMTDGAEYTAWAESVLHDGPGFATAQEREAWRLHTEGLSQADIAPALTIARRSVRRLLARTEARVLKVSKVKRWQNQKKQRMVQAQQLVRRCDPETLAQIVALMARASVLS